MNESATYHYLTYGLGFDPTESASKCEESRLERTLNTPMSLHKFHSVLLFSTFIVERCCEGFSHDDSVRETFFSHAYFKGSTS